MTSAGRGMLALLAAVMATGAATESACAAEPSAAYRAVLRRTLEMRKARREARASASAVVPVGRIEPYPMPPTLIIRQTREAHGEIDDLLRLLRR